MTNHIKPYRFLEMGNLEFKEETYMSCMSIRKEYSVHKADYCTYLHLRTTTLYSSKWWHSFVVCIGCLLCFQLKGNIFEPPQTHRLLLINAFLKLLHKFLHSSSVQTASQKIIEKTWYQSK